MTEISTAAGASLETLNRELAAYHVVREVGHGAMGVVFEARQKSLGRQVAIKVLPANLALRERTVKRFLREAEAMGRLSHPHIVSVYDVGSIEQLHYFSMIFVEGPPLDVVLKAGPMAIADVIQIGIRVADALAHAHSRGVLHRDIKPGNLLRDGDSVVLTDFGLARPLDSEDAGTMTESGDLVGTPLYMSPEQISGDSDGVDGRADVWGLGVTLYELLTQRTPFAGPNAQGILHSILHKDPTLLRKLRDDVPRDLEAVLLKCLEKDPGRRYSGAAALRDDLIAISEGRAVSASSPKFYDPALRWIRRHPMEASLFGGAILMAGALWGGLQQSQQQLTDTRGALQTAEEAREQAEEQQATTLKERQAASARKEIDSARILWAAGDEQATAEALEKIQVLMQEMAATRVVWESGTRSERREAEIRLFQLMQPMNQALEMWNEARISSKGEAEERIVDLLDSLDQNEHPEIIAEGLSLIASWMHAREGGDDQVLASLNELTSDLEPRIALSARAAVYTGLERFSEALVLHRDRAQLDPLDGRPILDSARIHLLMAERAKETQPALFLVHAKRALALLEQALDNSVRAEDGELVTTILIERTHCLLSAGEQLQPGYLDRCRSDLALALEHDPARIEAKSLLRATERRIEARQAALATIPAPVEDGEPALSLSDLLTGGESLDTASGLESAADQLESAGRGLQSIYRGLSGLLRSAAEPDPDPTTSTRPTTSPQPTRPPPARPQPPNRRDS